jgi:hypothetical protein
LAKARLAGSDADLRDLEFVEQESGTKQERDLQKIGEQARSQAQLKLIDQQTTREKMGMELLKARIQKKPK